MTQLNAALASTPAQWALLLAAVIAAVLIHGAIWRLIARHRRADGGSYWRLANRLRRPARLLAMVLALVAVVPLLNLSFAWRGWLEQFAIAAIVGIAGWVVMVAVDLLIDRSLEKVSLDSDPDVEMRKHATQLRVLKQTSRILIFLLTAGLVLSTFQSVRQYGVSLFASAGAAGLIVGFAARPVLANVIAGIQIALTQPIRIGDAVIVENEWGWVEEISATYVVIRIWDLRRMIVPLSYFIERPFQNWTREEPSIIGSVIWHLDYTAPVAEMRDKLTELVSASERWDGKVVNLQVVDATPDTIQVRGLMSARNSPLAWDLRCEVREAMIVWLQDRHPGSLPRVRAEMAGAGMAGGDEARSSAGGADAGEGRSATRE